MKKIKVITAVMITVFLMGCSTNLKDGVTYLEEGKYEEIIELVDKKILENQKENTSFQLKLNITQFFILLMR